ncbi:MAG: putative ABC transporter ATP-binding protein [Beijerinckiaceae bacterium]|nr:MAG: putative ABC transporter ATP-binding protein [Beijerinckiaceae bacterium]
MRAILDHCGAVPLEHMAGGSVILKEGQNNGRVYVLVEGRIEVLRGGTEVTVLDEPGSLVGEMSVLLGVPHTATARALGDIRVHVIQDAAEFFRAHPTCHGSWRASWRTALTPRRPISST